MPNILDAIQVSGASYDLKDKNAPSVSSLTQSEYDNLPSTAKTSNTFFVITDAQGGDLSNYWTTAQTQSAITEATSGLQETLVSGTNIKTINNESLLGSGNIDIQGGGKAISGGTNISVTTGETADTVSCTLPLTVGSSNSSLSLGVDNSLNNSSRIFAIGDRNSIGNMSSNSLVGGMRSSINYNCASSIAFGYEANVGGKYSCSIGCNTKTSNDYEAAFGRYNASNTGSTDADKTRFSVGNGTSDNARHNAFEIRQNGDIYCSDGTNDVKLQDTITATAANTTALGGLSLVKLTQSAYDALSPNYDSNTLYVIVN